ncbi:MAG: hypothetical protein HC842_06220, partial [Cytophagales bacterium]|nr:hypothetical protein [Cytophagales bacterium]
MEFVYFAQDMAPASIFRLLCWHLPLLLGLLPQAEASSHGGSRVLPFCTQRLVDAEPWGFEQAWQAFEQGSFTCHPGERIYRRLAHKQAWMQQPVCHTGTEPLSYYALFRYAYAEEVRLFVRRSAGTVDSLESWGLRYPASAKGYNFPVWRITLGPGECAELFLEVRDDDQRTRIQVEWQAEDDFMRRSQ